MDELKEELKVKEADLKEIIKANEKEEAKLRTKRKEIEALTKKQIILLTCGLEKPKRKSSCNNSSFSLLWLP